MSDNEQEAAREDYEEELRSRILCEEALPYVLANEELKNQILKDEALPYVCAYQFEEIENLVFESAALEWLKQSRDWLELINIISQHDGEELRNAIRYKAAHGELEPVPRKPSDVLLFGVASSVSKFLESLTRSHLPGGFPLDAGESNEAQPQGDSQTLDEERYGYRCVFLKPLALYAKHCSVDGNWSWVDDLVTLTRRFRDILFAKSGPELESKIFALRQWFSLKAVDAVLEKGKRHRLVYAVDRQGEVKFDREPNPTTTPLSTLLAEWMCDYLVKYSERIDLGACVECGKIFPRQRRDNAYCSKTCQNRVAYKRKKIFESGLLKKIEITARTAADKLQRGIWVYHPRLGIGMIDRVVKNKEQGGLNAIVRFPHVVRAFKWDFFRWKPDAAGIEFYTETDAATLAELL
jgi:hypothetical protein